MTKTQQQPAAKNLVNMPTKEQQAHAVNCLRGWLVRLRRWLACALRFSAHHVDVLPYKQITNVRWQGSPDGKTEKRIDYPGTKR